MTVEFFERPILNSPYEYPAQHWELDADGQPTNEILETRRRSELITPVPKPKKRRRNKAQVEMVLDGGGGLSSEEQEYNPTPIINEIRSYVEAWRNPPNPDQWQVTPESARLLQHWRHHQFQDIRPFFCQVEAVETAIWLTEVAGLSNRDKKNVPKAFKKFLEHLKGANEQANPELLRVALKLATGAGKTTVIAILIGPEFGTVARPDLVAAAREAGEAGFDVLIACAFNFDAHSAEFDKLGRIPVLKARMNADLHMAEDLKNTGQGNPFVVFGEPDIEIEEIDGPDGDGQLRGKIRGVDVFHPQTGEIESSGPDGIACWFIDTVYNEESFFVRHAYFLGASDPYKALKTTLKAEIDRQAWESLHSDTYRPFDKPSSGRIAVKVINHLGDEVMKVFGVA